MKYKVRIEIETKSCDLATYEVEANSIDEAKKSAINKYEKGIDPIDIWASDYIESSIDKQCIGDWEVEQLD